MSLQFVLGASGSGKTYTMYQEVIQKALEHPNTNYLMIVPEQFTMQTQKDMVMMHPNKGIMNIDVLSFGRLAHRIFDAAGGNNRTILDDTGKSLILRRLASRKEKELTAIGRNLRKIGYISEVKSVISEFLQYDISETFLQEILQNNQERIILHDKLNDIAVLYHDFLDFMKEKYITTEELLDCAMQIADRAAFLKNSEIYFDGFTGFTPVQNRFLGKMMCLSEKVEISVLYGDSEELFALSAKTIELLTKTAEKNHVEIIPPNIIPEENQGRFQMDSELKTLEKELFRFHSQPEMKEETRREASQGMVTEQIFLAEAENKAQEIFYVGKKIHELVREKGYRYRDIAILTGDTASYEKDLQVELKKYDIPFFMDSTFGILLNPFTEMIHAVIEMIQKNFSYESVFRYLKSGFSDFSLEETDILDQYVQAAGVRGKAQYFKVFQYCPDFVQTEEKEKYLCMVNDLRERLKNQIEELTEKIKKSKKYPASEYVTSLYDFIQKQRVYEKLKEKQNYFAEKHDLEREKEYGQIYQMVLELFDRIMELLPEEVMTLQEFSEILDAGFGEIRVGMIPPSVDQVLIGDMQRSRLAKVQALFLIGVNDGVIPPNSRKGGILSEMDRELLLSQNVELSPTTRQQTFIQRLYLYLYLTKPEKELYLSFPLISSDGNSLHPSYLIEEIKEIFPNKIVRKIEREILFSEIKTPLEGFDAVLSNMQQEEQSSEYQALVSYYSKDASYQQMLMTMVQHAFCFHTENPINRAVALAMYGDTLVNSVTRLEQFASCAYAHFIKYGLHLREEELFQFESKDMGTIFHGILNEYARQLGKSTSDWFNVSKEESKLLLDHACDIYLGKFEEGALYSTARNTYAVSRMKRILTRTVEVLTSQVRKGKFVPNEYEVAFSEITRLSAEEKIELRGRIDRLDLCETPDHLYVKVIDYKSGAKDFDLTSVFYGLSLQLVVYLNAAMKQQNERKTGKIIAPAGILYYHIDDPLIDRKEGMNEQEIREEIGKNLSMTGLLNDDPSILAMMDQTADKKSDVIPVSYNKDGGIAKSSSVATQEEIEVICGFVHKKIRELGERILNGEIQTNPSMLVDSNKRTACDYCKMNEICGFDKSLAEYHYHEINRMAQSEAIEKMRGEE